MISISNPIRSAAAARYYVDLTNEDYLTLVGEPMGTWFGRSAHAWGLEGKVLPETFDYILEGYSPGGMRPLVQNAGAADRQRGWDMTFSPGKSVSAVWSQGDGFVRAELEASQRVAVEAGLRYLEDNALLTRRGEGGSRRERVGMCAAIFEHGTSRAGDPQLHSHVVIASVCVREDGSTGAIHSRPLYAHRMVADALYRASLGHELIRRLGLHLIDNKGRPFEIAGVPPSLIAEFSKRRHAILQRMSERGTTGPEAARMASLATRPEKVHRPRAELFQQWQEAGRRLSWSTKQVDGLLFENKAPIGPILDKDVRVAIKRLDEYNAHFGFRDVIRAIADEVQAKGYRADQVEHAANRAILKLVPLGKVRGETHYATPSTLRLEKSLIDRVETGRNESRHQVSRHVAEKTLEGHSLSEEQARAFRHITLTPGNMKLVEGRAGTGKSTLCRAAREAWESAGFNVIGVCLTGKAREELEQNTGIRSFTLASLLLKTNKPLITTAGVTLSATSRSLVPEAPGWNKLAHLQVPKLAFGAGEIDGLQITDKTIVVLDEASMVGTRQFSDLFDRLTRVRAKLVCLGDAKQLGPIEAGTPFASLANRVETASLTEIQRQRHPWARQVVLDLADGNTGRAVRELESRGCIHVEASGGRAVSRLIDDWRRSGSPKESLILAATHEHVASLNEAAQERLLREGVLRPEKVDHGEGSIHVGDRVIFDRNNRRLGVANGTFGTVVLISHGNLVVARDSGGRVTVCLDRYPDISLGYAMTTHRAQGLTCENVFTYVSNEMTGREMAYVQASRARDQMHFYMEKDFAGRDLEGFKDALGPGRTKCMATDIKEGRFDVEREVDDRDRDGARDNTEKSKSSLREKGRQEEQEKQKKKAEEAAQKRAEDDKKRKEKEEAQRRERDERAERDRRRRQENDRGR